VYALFRRWQRAGAWAQIFTALQTRADAAGLITWDVSLDSTIARAHQHAASSVRPRAALSGTVDLDPMVAAAVRQRPFWWSPGDLNP
jgi:transposase